MLLTSLGPGPRDAVTLQVRGRKSGKVPGCQVLGDQGGAAGEEKALRRGQGEEELCDPDLEAGQGQPCCIAGRGGHKATPRAR